MSGSWFTDDEAYLFGEGNFLYCYRRFGAHFRTVEGVSGVQFSVWAPNAQGVSVIGPFNGWDPHVHVMQAHREGIWELFIPSSPVPATGGPPSAGLEAGSEYKFSIQLPLVDIRIDKSDPYGFFAEYPPGTASRVWPMDSYPWGDSEWVESRASRQALDQPLNIYEVHLSSWRRNPEDNRVLGYRQLAHELVDYVKEMGYTHIELLPVTEHPFEGSWGYQSTGYFAPTCRFGTPDDFKYFVDHCHQNGIGVILDWVPAHFPKDAHGLAYFDGAALYEYEDPRRGDHPDWGTKIFDYGRNEVRNFLVASALFWAEEYHIDGLRVDAVASMLYLDYSREGAEWIPNQHGGHENLDAISLLRKTNEVLHERVPGVLTIAEESSIWPMVSRPTYTGGLGFDYKWNMGWMHDTLNFFEMDPLFRRYNHQLITYSLSYAFSENFILPLSHDEVVHLKGSMLEKMPGDRWQKFAHLRLLYGFMNAHPGKKLLFMGGEFGQWREWTEIFSLDWHLLELEDHRSLQRFVRDSNRLYCHETALHQSDASLGGFQWIDYQDVDHSITSFVRRDAEGESCIVVVCNFTPVPRHGYRVGLPGPGRYHQVLNSDWKIYGGGGVDNPIPLDAEEITWQSASWSALMELPPLGVLYWRLEAD
ncbi:MAG: 1,4-alpha-glucan branching protein GlgB [Caldilineaceae bacterium]|nr:1,4-alpha-glucan branching protein GlgB [Caldilineaceae bacterium]MDE0461633.1 1,4-alpha-glucan branching protein GlgB [Caldilineaceae bacterium]